MNDPVVLQSKYFRKSCEIGIVHLGYGAFHRAHQAVYLDQLMEATNDRRWGIAAVNLRSSDSKAFLAASKAKDGYLVKTIAPNGEQNFRLVRPHLKFVDATLKSNEAYALLALPTVSMVTITVTESGYSFKNDWSLNLEDPTIASGILGNRSETVYEFLAEALALRARTIDMPITVLCCDNIRNNGKILQNALLAYLKAKSLLGLVDWVQKNVTFPCSMADRITPRSTPTLQKQISLLFPEFSTAPVHAETFLQWVLEDNFASRMPDLSKVGVQIVSNVEPYEEAKIRILNGGHTGLAYLGALAGYLTFDQAMSDPNLRKHFDTWEENEVLPGLDQDLPFDARNYFYKISQRFENKGISDQLERICMDGYSKMAIYIRPTIEACLDKDIFPEAGFNCIASWVVYARRYQSGACRIPYREPFWDKLKPIIVIGKENELAFNRELWGDLPQRFSNFAPSLVGAIKEMDKKWPT